MKEDNKILIDDIRNALQEIEHYDNPEQAFKIGWEGWRASCLRHGKHNKAFFSVKWSDGWLSRADAIEFSDYLKKGWIPAFV